jgi:hypothetical protein
MPVLFGNTYILPAIIVVVLLVLLLLVMVLRKRGSASGPSKTKAKPDTRAATPPRPTKVVRPPIQATPAAMATPAPEPAAEAATALPGTIEPSAAQAATATPAVAAAPAAVPAAVRHEVPRADMAPHTDPLQAVIVDILQGWGDITADDTKRLALFRPEKVLAAAQAMETPKELKSKQHARTRLTQLRQYAANRVEQARAQQAASAAAEACAEESEVPAAPAEPVAPVASVFAPQPKATEPEPAAAFQKTEEAEAPLVETDYADELSTWPEAQLEPAVYSPVAVPVETQFEAPAETPTVAPTEIALETPVEAPAEASLEAVQESPFETVAKPVVDPMAAEMPLQESSWLQQDAQAAPKWQAAGEPAFLDEPESSLSSLHVSIKTAGELLALPEHERPDMVAFLEPAELAKVFDGTNDPVLKKAIIDTLEHVSNPASLEVLRRCLDDPDPQIQVYALEAADRLLGVD